MSDGAKEDVVRKLIRIFLDIPHDAFVNLTRAIERLLSEPERAEAFGARGRERMLASFSISAMSQGNVSVYRAVMAARSEA